MNREQAINYLFSSGFTNEQVCEVVRALTYEPTTKNNLGVDLISRADAIRAMQDKAKKLTNEDTINGLCGAVAILYEMPLVTPRPCDTCRHYENSCHWLPSVTPQEPRCKDCKWWKDSDGKYRRGCGAESQCPINTNAVYCGEGYCYMFSPKIDMREVEE